MMKLFHKNVCALRKTFTNFSDKSSIYWNDKFDKNEEKFNKILIANRGEIACRIIDSCKRHNIKTVAIHSEVDYNSKFVNMADEAFCVGPAASTKSYLNMDAILDVVRKTGAQAVHPGYGFLSENTNFAKKLEDMNVVFLGPNSKAIKAMGDKIESKRIANAAKVSCIPGYDGEIKDVEEAIKIANQIGYPVMIKASAGGGGKGMRIARNDEETVEGFRLSRDEAKASFGDDRMLVEKFIDNPRHIEVQVLCDKHGNSLYLNERECSIQRRNQKVVEEAPSVFLDEATRKAMGEEAVSLARAVNYDSAGTVEFLVDSQKKFYFLEMNTRLQVEHPITECITGVDIVHQMLRIGKGHPLLLKQDDLKVKGWAVECRVYAEDPYKSFGLPSTGRLTKYIEPKSIKNVRCDSGIQEGSEISIYYDPMICKLVTYGDTRNEVLETTRKALDNYVIRGVTNNISLLRDIVSEKKFISGDISTNYLSEVYPDGFKGKDLEPEEDYFLACLSSVLRHKNELRFNKNMAMNSKSFVVRRGNGGRRLKCLLTYNREGKEFNISLCEWKAPIKVAGQKVKSNIDEVMKEQARLDNEPVFQLTIKDNFNLSDIIISLLGWKNQELQVQMMNQDNSGNIDLQYMGTKFTYEVKDETSAYYEEAYMLPKKVVDESLIISAPMPGIITGMNVKEGDRVTEGQVVCTLEAMKMQNAMTAAKTAVVKKVNFKQGDTISDGDIIVQLE